MKKETVGEAFPEVVNTSDAPAKTVRVPEPGRRANKWLLLWMIPAVLVYGAVANSVADNKSASSTVSACKSDWSKCADNVKMARNYEGWIEAQVRCKMEADKVAEYGTPEWPSFWSGTAFGHITTAENYKTTGIAVLLEPDVKLQNMYGAMVHTNMSCDYDLRTKKVKKLDWYGPDGKFRYKDFEK